MQVVDRQQQRPLDGDPLEQLDGRGEELAALVAEAPARRLLGRDVAEQRGKRRVAQLLQQLRAAVALQVRERRRERRVGGIRRVLAAAVEDEAAGGVDGVADLRQQPALAGPRFAGDQHGLALARRDP